MFERNVFPPQAAPEQFVLPRGAAHFSALSGNKSFRLP
jgi:hypothetical protein